MYFCTSPNKLFVFSINNPDDVRPLTPVSEETATPSLHDPTAPVIPVWMPPTIPARDWDTAVRDTAVRDTPDTRVWNLVVRLERMEIGSDG